MQTKKITKIYYFSVEGETELWYLSWLEKCINASEDTKYKVSLQCLVEKNPLNAAKRLTVLSIASYSSQKDKNLSLSAKTFHSENNRILF